MDYANKLHKRYELSQGLTYEYICEVEKTLHIKLPKSYLELLTITNGLHTNGCLMLLAVEDLKERNRDYEVSDYMPNYIMIGDDSGGNAILMRSDSDKVYEVGMGVMDEEFLEISASSIEELLITYDGKTLGERESESL